MSLGGLKAIGVGAANLLDFSRERGGGGRVWKKGQRTFPLLHNKGPVVFSLGGLAEAPGAGGFVFGGLKFGGYCAIGDGLPGLSGWTGCGTGFGLGARFGAGV